MKKLVTGAAIGLAMWVIPASIAGMIVCFSFDVLGEDDLLPYAIWFVIGIFAGLFAFQTGAAWAIGADDPGEAVIPPAIARRMFVAQLLMLAGLSLSFYGLLWREGTLDELFVPGSMPHTLTFFASMVGGMLLARAMSVDEGAEKIKAGTVARWRGPKRPG